MMRVCQFAPRPGMCRAYRGLSELSGTLLHMETSPQHPSPPLAPTPGWFLRDDEIYPVAGRPAEHWLLELVGTFSALQSQIEFIIEFSLGRHSPKLAKKIKEKHLGRLSDGDRWDYVKALAADARYEGALLASASDAFWRCKHVRDLVGHHEGTLRLARDRHSPMYFYVVTEERRKPQIPNPLTPEEVQKIVVEIRWLDAFVDYISYLAGNRYISRSFRVGENGQPQPRWLEILEPPPIRELTLDWTKEGLHREVPDPMAPQGSASTRPGKLND